MLTGKAVRECVVDAAIISTLDVCSRMAFLIVLSVPSLISLMFPRLSGVGFHAGRVSSHVINDSFLMATEDDLAQIILCRHQIFNLVR